MVNPAAPLAEFIAGTSRGHAGWFRAAQTAGDCWWLIDSAGQPFYLRGVNGVAPLPDGGYVPVLQQLRGWSCNAIGLGAEESLERASWPFVAAVEFTQVVPLIHTEGVRLPDVFDVDWPTFAAAEANRVVPRCASSRDLVCWVADPGLAWGAAVGGSRPSLLQLCLSLEPSFAAYHAAWEFVLALHEGELAQVARAWGEAPWTNREVVREMTRAGRVIRTRGYARDQTRWMEEFARRYLTVVGEVVHAADPNHLVFVGVDSIAATRLVERAFPHVDGVWFAGGEIDGRVDCPVIAGDFTWSTEAFLRAPQRGTQRRLTSIERMLRRGRAAGEKLARHPSLVGYLWRAWRDREGDRPPFGQGLRHEDGTEALEHTELLAELNRRAHLLHVSCSSSTS